MSAGRTGRGCRPPDDGGPGEKATLPVSIGLIRDSSLRLEYTDISGSSHLGSMLGVWLGLVGFGSDCRFLGCAFCRDCMSWSVFSADSFGCSFIRFPQGSWQELWTICCVEDTKSFSDISFAIRVRISRRFIKIGQESYEDLSSRLLLTRISLTCSIILDRMSTI